MPPREELPWMFLVAAKLFLAAICPGGVCTSPLAAPRVSGSHHHTGVEQDKNAIFCEQNHPKTHSSSPKDSPDLPITRFWRGMSSWHLLPKLCALVLGWQGWSHAYCKLPATPGHGCPWLDRGWQPLLRSHILAHAGTNMLPAGNEAE